MSTSLVVALPLRDPPTMKYPQPLCIYCTATETLVDYVHPNETASTALKRLSSSFGPSLQILPVDEASHRSDNARTTQPIDITAQHFHTMLEMLQPVGWTNLGHTESFKLSERLSGEITSIFVRLGDRHFQFYDRISTRHEDACSKVRASLPYVQNQARTEIR